MPSINGSANHTYNTGRRIDPFTNQFATNVVLSQNFSVSGGMNLFSGLSNTHTIRGNQLAVIAGNQLNITREQRQQARLLYEAGHTARGNFNIPVCHGE